MFKNRFFLFFALAIILGSFAVRSWAVLAATATPASYHLSRQQKAVAANHEIRVKLPNGISSSAHRITFEYTNGFNLDSIDFGDIDLFYGPVTGLEHEATLAVAPAPGVWRVTAASGQMQFTAPSDAGVGTIPAGDYIVVRIGTNANGGVHQVVNPDSSPQIIRLGTSVGDNAFIYVPLMVTDSVTVTATVPAPPAGGGGDAGDVTPPIMSNIQAVNITTSTASITWTTNESADSNLDYGLTLAYGSTFSNATLVANHQIDIASLSPNTMYHFRVSSRDVVGNSSVSGDFTFTTAVENVVQPLIVLSNIQTSSITDTSAQIDWQTNINADSRLEYGLTAAYGTTLSDAALKVPHTFALAGLAPSTTYHVQISSQALGATGATSSDFTFTTLADTTAPPNVINFTATPAMGSLTLHWTNPADPDFAGVRIVRKLGAFPSGPLDGVLVYSGNEGIDVSVVDPSLDSGTVYFYAAFAYDAILNYASGALASATPLAPPPAAVENTPVLCTNGLDDDGNGKADCVDVSCAALLVCANAEPPKPPEPPPVVVPPPPEPVVDPVSQPIALPSVGLPTSTAPTLEGEVIVLSPSFFTAGGTVELVPDASGQFGAPIGTVVNVSIPVAGFGAEPDKAFITVGQSAYNLVPSANKNEYRASFFIQGADALPVTISMTFKGGGTAISHYTIMPQFGGQVVFDALGQAATPIAGARVQLFVDQGGVWVPWNSGAFNQANPQTTNENGGFSFFLPQGRYYAEVQKDGYRKTVTTPRVITRGVFGERIGLLVIPPALFDGVSSTAPLVENVKNVTQNAAKQFVYTANVVRDVIQRPAVQEAVQTKVSPAVLAVAVANAATALPLFNGLAYLQYIFLQPILLFERRKKKQWGVVYDSLTKQPIDLVIVRLLRADARVVVQTRVTDKLGRYSFSVKPGTYILEVIKPGFTFPTHFLKDQTIDGEYLDVYQNTPIILTEEGMIGFNIPIDPSASEVPPREVVRQKRLRLVQQYLSFVTVLLSMIGVVISPTLQMGLILLVQVVMYLLFKRLSISKKIPDWGMVTDELTKTPLGQVVVRIFDKKFNKVLETQVTDKKGKYGFFVRQNVYYVTAEKQDYQKYTSPDVDLTGKDEALVDQNIVMKKPDENQIK